jgi:hypothetical protein
MKRFIQIIIIGCLMLSGVAYSNEEEAKAGSLVAQQWLEMADSGKYKQCWSSAHPFFQAMNSEDKWVKNMRKTRNKLGVVIERTLSTSKYMTKLPTPGAPEGEYVISTFDTTFKKKGRKLEVVIVAKTDDGLWQVTSTGITSR